MVIDSKHLNLMSISKLTLSCINARIKREVCHKTLKELSDETLLSEYKKCNSVISEIQKLNNVLKKHIDNDETKQQIIQEYLLELIPPGTKGVIRGNRFNAIVKRFITNLGLDTHRFEIAFEKKCASHMTNEIPDWYILEKSTNKILIGMNQLDLTSGGHQLNRGYKYLVDSKHNHLYSKLLCVICNEIELKSDKNKVYHLFKTGFENDTLCYLNNLENIINSYFNQ